ncbi:MAG: exo-alpha-sialidase [Lentisphaeria bacterium]|nr:exo-alpha-sialidase [Lentisphaeria bacterium]
MEENGMKKIVLLPPGPKNPRNSEGDFIQLRDGRVLFVYTHFTSGRGDHAKAFLAGRFSSDGGDTWTEEDTMILPNEGEWNIMSVSMLRLQDGRIALFYMRKNSLSDCRPLVRISTDEAETWSEPVGVIPNEDMGYYVLNNDRVVQLKSGRILLPVALHNRPGWKNPDWVGEITCFLSDDLGRTWRCCKTRQKAYSPKKKRVVAQEPGVVELKGGRVMMFVRTNVGVQYCSFSEDGGESWSALEPSDIASPQSPASIERIPTTGDLLMVWNNHAGVSKERAGLRTPFTTALSLDEGKTWVNVRTIEEDPQGWYCYTAVEIVGDHVLLGHCSGKRSQALATTQITRFPVRWLYGE